MNLNDEYLPYKYIIGQVILDVSTQKDVPKNLRYLYESQKNPSIRTVVNKLNSIHAEFRFFDMELIAGIPDYVVSHVSAC